VRAGRARRALAAVIGEAATSTACRRQDAVVRP
jgi:hypothetical protein